MSLETLKGKSLRGEELSSVGNARLSLPSRGNLSFDVIEYFSFDLQSMLEPLASFASSFWLNTNQSQSISFSWLDGERNKIALFTDVDRPTETVIPRDPSSSIPPMFFIHVTGEREFHFHSIDIKPNSSIQFDVHPLTINLSYASEIVPCGVELSVPKPDSDPDNFSLENSGSDSDNFSR